VNVQRLNRLLAASPSLLFGILVAKLWVSGTLRYYVNDRTAWVVLAGGGLFLLIGLTALARAWVERQEPGLSWRSVAFLVPLLLGILLPAHPLSVASGQASSLGALQLASHVSSGSPGDSFGVWVGDLSTHPDPQWWAGRHVTLVGFVARQAGLPHRGFIVGRYLVTCCVVDATLMGFPVQLDHGPIPSEGAWLQVDGIFGRQNWTDPSGSHYPIIQHARVVPVSIPSSPYLSP
jgi:uncharacterized repeat protein (TIGR03943 family)